MTNLRFHRPSPALVVACVALFVALGGTGYAAITLKKNSVAAKHLKKNSVTSPKIRDRTILARDLAPATQEALRGQKGDKGDPCLASDPACRGPQGEPATRLWAVVKGDGSIARSSNAAITVSRVGTGAYDVNFGTPTGTCAVSAVVGTPDTSVGSAFGEAAIDYLGAGRPNEVKVFTSDSAGAAADRPFHVALLC